MEKDHSAGEGLGEVTETGWENMDEVEFRGDIKREARQYDGRMDALREAIMNGEGSDEEKTREIQDLDRTLGIVLTHVDYRLRRPPSDVAGARMFDERRTAAHDRMIAQLNKINMMADQYGVEVFTGKSYVTKREFSGRTPTSDERAKIYSDRAEVEEFFDEVFKDEIEKEENDIIRNNYE